LIAVGGNLGAQRLERVERPLVAEPLDEPEPDRGAVEIPVEVEDVGLDGDAPRVVHRRPEADVGHRRPHDAVDRGRRGVDTVGRQELVLRAQVRGRKPERPAAVIAVHDAAVDVVLVPQQGPRLVHPPLADQTADPGAADDEVP
jgi:hypothetical protein